MAKTDKLDVYSTSKRLPKHYKRFEKMKSNEKNKQLWLDFITYKKTSKSISDGQKIKMLTIGRYYIQLFGRKDFKNADR